MFKNYNFMINKFIIKKYLVFLKCPIFEFNYLYKINFLDTFSFKYIYILIKTFKKIFS